MKKITGIALCGGGFYGYGEVGALVAMELYKEYFDIKRIKGASVGSMVGALYAVGYSPKELSNIIFNIDFDQLIKDTRFTYLNLYDKYGLHDAKRLEDEIERLIQEKTHIKNCTFSQISIDLTIIATNLNYQRPRFFNKETTPDMIISRAVRMSIGYPLYMTPVLFEGDLYADGGISINYPIIMFKELDETIGITFVAHNEHPNGDLKYRTEIKSVHDCIESTALTMSRTIYTLQITPEYLKRSITVNIPENIKPMQFNLSLSQKHFIYNCGIRAVLEQLHQILNIPRKEIKRSYELPVSGSVSINKSDNELEEAMDQLLFSVSEIEKAIEALDF